MVSIHQKLFSHIHSSYLVYNTCWEDPRLDREALNLNENDRLLVITSAGCNALDYLLAGAGHVDAVDMNPRQNYLLELKSAAAQSLTWPEFFQMFGRGWVLDTEATFKRVSKFLSPRAAQFWGRNHKLFARSRTGVGFYFRGSSGLIARVFGIYIDHIARVRNGIAELLETSCIKSQRRAYVRSVRSRFWSRGAGVLADSSLLLSCAGVPPAQAKALGKSMNLFVRRAVDSVFGKISMEDNYFWRVYLTGEYTPDCCPEYLKEANFSRLREVCANRLGIYTDTVQGHLERSSVSYSKIVLLDHMDWLHGNKPELLNAEWQAIANKAAQGARIIWRSAHREPDFVNSIAVQRHGTSRRVGDILSYDHSLARHLHRQDRVHTYSSFAIATMH